MKNQVRSFSWLLLVFVLVSCFGMVEKKGNNEKIAIESRLTVVELFTSEGCSSCPPADALLSKIDAENKDVLVLSYHVDYWDRLGWKDPFSQAAFTDRQRQYAQAFNLESIYTPQVVINGTEEFVGSDETRLRASLSSNNALNSFAVTINRLDAATVNISYKVDAVTEPSLLYIALVQPATTTAVKRGENGGRTLLHVNVVRQLTTIEARSISTSAEIKIPASLQATTLKTILFVQQKKDNRILAASSVLIPSFPNSQKQ